MTRYGLFVLTAVATGAPLVAACPRSAKSAPHAAAAVPVASTVAERHLELDGTYVQPAVTPTGMKATGSNTSPFQVQSGTVWHGDLEGQTTFKLSGVVNLKT